MAFTLERYVLRQTVQAFLVGLFAMTGMLFLGMAGSLMHRGYNVIQLRAVWGYLLLYSLPYALPMALLCAVVMTFGRMSGDNEVLAAQSSGVRPGRLAAPVLLFGAILSAGSLWLNHWALPTAHLRVDQFREAVFRMVIENLGVAEPNFEIPPYQVYVHSVDPETGEWLHVVIFHAEGTLVRRVMRAERARALVFEDQERAQLRLRRCFVLEPSASAKGVEALDRWMQVGPAGGDGLHPLPGSVTSGPMDITIDIDLAQRRRRHMDRPNLKTLPDLREEIRETADGVAGLPPVRRPAAERAEMERRRNSVFRDYQRAHQELAHLKATVAEAEEEVRKAALEAEQARSRLAGRRRELERQQERAQRLAQEQVELESELAAAREDGAQQEGRALLEERVASTLAARREAEAAAGELAREVAADEEALAALTSRLAAKRQALAEARTPVERAEARNEALSQEFEEASEARNVARAHESHAQALVEFHSRNASAAVCLAFVLVGVPLGLLARRGNLVYALALSFAVALLVYYPLTMVAHMLSVDRYLPIALAFWAPVAAVGMLGLALHSRVARR